MPDKSLAELRAILQDDIYLLPADKAFYSQPPAPSEPEHLPPVVEETPVASFKYAGDNQKKFLVLSHYPADEAMPEAHLTALQSTLARIQYHMADIALVNLAAQTDTTWPLIQTYFEPQKILILGADSLPAGLTGLRLNEPVPVNNVMVLYTFSFTEMMGNKENTKLFWNQIKTF